MKFINQFTDRFKFLSESANTVDSLRSQIVKYLAQSLPTRILSKANIFNLTLDVVQDISNLSMLEIENSLQENNILTAQYESSVRGIAGLSGHKAVRVVSSRGSVEVRFLPGIQAITPFIMLGKDTTLKCANNSLSYMFNQNDDYLSVPTDVNSFTLDIIEGVRKEQEFVVDFDEELYTINLDDSNPIEHYSVEVYVNGKLFTKADSLYSMNSNTEGYIERNGFGNQVDIVFGDGTYGKKLKAGDVVTVSYIISNGEAGNLLEISDNLDMVFNSGVLDSSGEEIDISDYVEISYASGFCFGSNGENINVTRLVAGYSDRSLTFSRADSLKAFLSRLTTLSHVDCWIDEDNPLVFNVIALPNIKNKIKAASDYLYLPEESLQLSAAHAAELVTMINNTRRQAVATEIMLNSVKLRKYAIFVYVDAQTYDLPSLKQKIVSNICDIVLQSTFMNSNVMADNEISKSALVNAVYDMPEVNRVSINIFSEENENARILGYYDKTETVNVGSAKKKKIVRVNLQENENHLLGFSQLGDIRTKSKFEIPIIRGDFSKYSPDGNHFNIAEAITVFVKDINNTWKTI